jgi:hypothetical protein
MVKFRDFLVERAKFPFPLPDESRSVNTTDISLFEVGLLEREWKAKFAVRDDDLVQNLCNGLENILGETALSAKFKTKLLARFSPQLESFDDGGGDDDDDDDDDDDGQLRYWLTNPNESRASFQKIPCNPG